MSGYSQRGDYRGSELGGEWKGSSIGEENEFTISLNCRAARVKAQGRSGNMVSIRMAGTHDLCSQREEDNPKAPNETGPRSPGFSHLQTLPLLQTI
jgi:hypothetical protein